MAWWSTSPFFTQLHACLFKPSRADKGLVKVMFAYLSALQATKCWPVRKYLHEMSIHEVLDAIKLRFKYAPYGSLSDVPRTPAEAHLPKIQVSTESAICRECDGGEGFIKARLERKVKDRMAAMLNSGPKFPNSTNFVFQCLCIDCLTKTKTYCWDSDYWSHVDLFQYDHLCSNCHGQVSCSRHCYDW